MSASASAVHRDLVGPAIDRERADGAGGKILGPRQRSARHRADAGEQLAEAERLDHVVVRAELEADDPVDLVATRGHHDDRDLRTRAEPAAHLEAVEIR